MRISARLGSEHVEKLQALQRIEDIGTTEIVKRSIDLYYERVKQVRNRPASAFQTSGFVGCGDGPEDLSEHYKEELGTILDAKCADR